MIIELGNFSLSLLAFLALSSFCLVQVGIKNRELSLIKVALSGQIAQFLAILFCAFAFLRAFVSIDFSLEAVRLNTSVATPLIYRISTAMGSGNGFLLFVVFFVTVIGLFLSVASKKAELFFAARAISFNSLIVFLFTIYIIFFANPFVRADFLVDDGNELNAVFQNYYFPTFYACMFVVVAFLTAVFVLSLSLLYGGNHKEWFVFTNIFSKISWLFLSLAIILNVLWSYYETSKHFGWNWDLIDNSLLVMWLSLCALQLSLYINKNKDTLYSWTLFLSFVSFCFSMFYVLVSHVGFNPFKPYVSSNENILVFVFVFIIFCTFASMIFVKNISKIHSNNKYVRAFSKNIIMVLIVSLLVAISFIIFGASFYILLSDLFSKEVSKGISSSFYNKTVSPLILIVMFLMALSYVPEHLFFNQKELFKYLKFSLIAFWAVFLLNSFYLEKNFDAFIFALVAGFLTFVLITMFLCFIKQPLKILTPHSFFNLGICLILFSFVAMSFFKEEQSFLIKKGETVEFSNYIISLNSIKDTKKNNYSIKECSFWVQDKNGNKGNVISQMRIFNISGQKSYQSGFYHDFKQDLVFKSFFPEENKHFRVYVETRPFAFLLMLGFFMSIIGIVFYTFNRNKDLL